MKFDRLLSALFITMLLISTTTLAFVTIVNIASASPSTNIYVSQSVVTGKAIGATFPIDVNVTDAPTTFAWEVHLTWDPNTLELFFQQEGEFLKRGIYTTTFSMYPGTFAEANVKGEITVGCTLNNPLDPWATGNARLFRFGFRVKANGSTLIDLFGTVLLDHLESGSPAPTLYPNSDSFFYNVSPSHDISGRARYITLINPSVHGGDVANINVTVLNEGTVTETSVTINVYANGTLIGTTSVSVSGTGNFENRKYTYTVPWNTAGFAVGRYNISATVPAVPGEVDVADNTFMGEQQVKVWSPGDVNHDGVVNVIDAAAISAHWYPGPPMGPSGYDLTYDINNDGNINVLDAAIVSGWWTGPPKGPSNP